MPLHFIQHMETLQYDIDKVVTPIQLQVMSLKSELVVVGINKYIADVHCIINVSTQNVLII